MLPNSNSPSQSATASRSAIGWLLAAVLSVALIAAPACVSNPTPHPGSGDGTGSTSGGFTDGGTGLVDEPSADDGATDGQDNAGSGGTSEPPLDSLSDASAGGSPDLDASDGADGADGADGDDAGPTDFTGTACEGGSGTEDDYDECLDNVGCTELEVECGECVCTLCADQDCVEVTCDDGGSEDCPGSPFGEEDAGASDEADAGSEGDQP